MKKFTSKKEYIESKSNEGILIHVTNQEFYELRNAILAAKVYLQLEMEEFEWMRTEKNKETVILYQKFIDEMHRLPF